MLRLKQGWSLLKEAIRAWSDDTLFSIAPLLLIVIAVAGLFFGDDAARGEITAGLQGLMGEEGAKAIEGMVANASRPKEGILASVIGVFALIYKLMPRAKIEWHDVWVGAAGSLAVVMIWVYYSAQIFLLGAEFTWVYAHAHGSRRGQKRPDPELRFPLFSAAWEGRRP